MGLRLIAIAKADHDQGPDVLREESGVVTDWFARHACAAAIVRPDHYVYSVAADEAGLTAMLTGLETRLQ
jgi:3-(3-hydroxy-phenyl)propionate hydroxylase